MYIQSENSKAAHRDPYEVFAMLPSNWQESPDAESLKDYANAIQLLHSTVYDRCEYLKAAVGVHTLKQTRGVERMLLVLEEAQLVDVSNTITYGSGLVYGQGSFYGQIDLSRFSWKLPSGVVDVGCVQDQPNNPSVVWDSSWVRVEDGYLVFRQNPFDVLSTSVSATGRVVEVWLCNVQIDDNVALDRYGSLLGLDNPTQAGYVDEVRQAWAITVTGPTFENLSRLIHAAVAIPYTAGGEVVESIETSPYGLHIITDDNSYRFPATANPIVAVGDVLVAGQQLTDALAITDLTSGRYETYPSINGLHGLTLSPAETGLAGEITFPNQTSKWAYHGTDDVRFPLVGSAADIAAFWEAVYTRGQAAADSLASLLGITGPFAVKEVNPMLAVLSIVGGSTMLVRIKADVVQTVDTSVFRRLPSLFPTHARLLFVQELSAAQDSYELADMVDTVMVSPAIVASETMSTSATDLTFSDFNPLVSVS